MADHTRIATAGATPADRPRDDFRMRLRRFFERYPPLVMIAGLWLLTMIAIAILATQLAPYDYAKMDLYSRLQPPIWLEGGKWNHLFGTDDLGRDVLSRLIFSIRMSLLVAFLGTIIGAVFGTAVGFVAAHFRGWVDDFVMMCIDFQASLPFMIIALAVLAFFGNSLFLFIALMGIYGWERYARITRGLALSASTHGYAVAVSTFGGDTFAGLRPAYSAEYRKCPDRQYDAQLPRHGADGNVTQLPRSGHSTPAHEPRQHAGLRPGLSDHGVVDCRPSRYDDLLRDTGNEPPGRLGPGSPRSDLEMSDRMTVRDPPATSA